MSIVYLVYCKADEKCFYLCDDMDVAEHFKGELDYKQFDMYCDKYDVNKENLDYDELEEQKSIACFYGYYCNIKEIDITDLKPNQDVELKYGDVFTVSEIKKCIEDYNGDINEFKCMYDI